MLTVNADGLVNDRGIVASIVMSGKRVLAVLVNFEHRNAAIQRSYYRRM